MYKTSRKVGWIIAPLVFLIGLLYSRSYIPTYASIQLILLSFPYSILLFGINDIYDNESDIINPRKDIYVDKNTERFVYKVSVLTVCALLAVSVCTLNYFNMASTATVIIFSFFYSAHPLRLKEKPFIDSLSNGIIFFAVFSMGYSFGGDFSDIPLKIYYVALCVMGIHAFGAALDCETDKVAGHKTLAVYLGKTGALIFTFTTFFVAYLFAGIGSKIINIYLLFCSFLSLIALIFPFRRLELILFKLIFGGFVATSIIFMFNYIKI